MFANATKSIQSKPHRIKDFDMGTVTITVGDANLCPNWQTAMTGINQAIDLTLTASDNWPDQCTDDPLTYTIRCRDIFWNTGDSDLDNLVGGSGTEDAAVLEFDFVSTASFQLQIQYVFASEEYPEFTGSQFNDLMAVFVTTNHIGTNWINSLATDIALVPSTSLPVAVNNVNGGYAGSVPATNPQYYIDNDDPNEAAEPPYAATSPVYNLQYDGFTTLLTGQTTISANVTYHVKIAIADYSDWIYDSAVFLKTQSFPCQ